MGTYQVTQMRCDGCRGVVDGLISVTRVVDSALFADNPVYEQQVCFGCLLSFLPFGKPAPTENAQEGP